LNRKLLVATNNKGKVREFKSLLKNIHYELVTLGDVGISTVVEETGATMEENAQLKATRYAVESKLLTLADDSGLEVDALAGEPGVRSARYAGDNASDVDRVNYLLSKLISVPWEKRTARFKCVIAIATPEGKFVLCNGECHGLIALQPKGDNGFGYDPVFYFPNLGKTMAELPSEVKSHISHRAIAANKIPEILMHFSLNT
jgi:XTP/dITP diphosphohydrolase